MTLVLLKVADLPEMYSWFDFQARSRGGGVRGVS